MHSLARKMAETQQTMRPSGFVDCMDLSFYMHLHIVPSVRFMLTQLPCFASFAWPRRDQTCLAIPGLQAISMQCL